MPAEEPMMCNDGTVCPFEIGVIGVDTKSNDRSENWDIRNCIE